MSHLDETVAEQVSKAVEKAMEVMRLSLTDVLTEGQTLATKSMGAENETLVGRLEGRINRRIPRISHQLASK